jgi:hypothetical protein
MAQVGACYVTTNNVLRGTQRVLNDLYRTRLFRRMIWLHPPQQSHRKTETERQLADGIGWQGMDEEANHTTPRKPGPP